MTTGTQDSHIAGWRDARLGLPMATFAVVMGLALGAAGAVPLLAQEGPDAPTQPPTVATPQEPATPATEPLPPDAADDEEPAQEIERRSFRCDNWSHRPVFKLGQDHHVRASESVRDAVVVFGSAVVEGEVCGDLVVVLGNVELASTAYVRDTLTVVGGTFTAAPGAEVAGDLVVVGGAMDVPPTFVPGREQVLIGLPILGDRLMGFVPWLTRGLLYGRLIVPDLAWNWYVVGITLFVVLMLNLLFPRATQLSTAVIQSRPLSAFAAGLLVLLLSGPVVTLLAVSIIGTAIVPVVMLGMFAAWLVGSIAVARWIGTSLIAQDDPESRGESTRSLLIGFAVKVVAYMIPVVGITVWSLAGVLGLGAATLAFVGAFRAENPRRTPPVMPPPPPPSGPGDPADWSRSSAAASASAAAMPPSGPPESGTDDWPVHEEPPRGDTLRDTPLPPIDLRRFPRGAFLERLAALTLDAILVAIVNGVLDLTNRDGAFVILLVAYHVVFWAWKGTTIGGIICQLRIVRVDGRSLTFSDALVRALTGVFSAGALGIGFLWILRDEQRQSWHDLVAGTYVVKVPRAFPLP